MTERDSFGLTYSHSVNKSRGEEAEKYEGEEEKQQLSPSKQTMLETFKASIMKPLPTEEVISSLTSV